jgi:hypothetical protein
VKRLFYWFIKFNLSLNLLIIFLINLLNKCIIWVFKLFELIWISLKVNLARSKNWRLYWISCRISYFFSYCWQEWIFLFYFFVFKELWLFYNKFLIFWLFRYQFSFNWWILNFLFLISLWLGLWIKHFWVLRKHIFLLLGRICINNLFSRLFNRGLYSILRIWHLWREVINSITHILRNIARHFWRKVINHLCCSSYRSAWWNIRFGCSWS